MKLTLRKAKILPDEKEKGKKKNPNKKSNRKKKCAISTEDYKH